MKNIEIATRRCHIWAAETGPVILWGVSLWNDQTLPDMDAKISEFLKSNPCTVIAFEADDWNADFSPWEADVEGSGHFAGKGKVTLQWVKEYAVPYIRQNITESAPVYIAGYSLAALFALWSFYETGLFSACICCSGSLWFPGWMEYAEAAQAPAESMLYLSLGGKEPNSKNPVMATVGDCYRLQDKLAEKGENILKHKFEWNPGGHFADSVKRVLKGVQWVTDNN